jgi:tricorn protease interacting factor F2/3
MPLPAFPVRPRRYRLRIEPETGLSRFRGRASIALEAAEPTRSVVLQSVGLEIEAIRLDAGGRQPPVVWSLAEGAESLRVEWPEAVTGPFELTIAYAGAIGGGMAGFYRSAYGRGKNRRPLAVTQFQESDARRAFPCLDHPRFKAAFEVQLVVGPGLEGISNGPLVEVADLADGRRCLRFGRTPVMSTYLVFWAVGSFETAVHAADPRLRAVTGPGDVHLAGPALDFGARALAFCERYFGIAYPLAKLDLIAVPDFAFGAMENWGAMTFRENLLLDDPVRTSRAGRERIRETVAHEITHQWFGNLVTPAEWTYLWLNESFATYFGYGIVDHHHPDWGVWDQFLLSQTAPALERDGLGVDTPIEIPGGEHLVINSSTAPIIYSKGGSLLRQFRAHLGEERFRRGLQGFLARHAYGCASSRDFWRAFEAPEAESPLDLMRPWVEQAGYPLVTARRDGAWLHLHQARFAYLTGDRSALWPIPLGLRTLDARGRPTAHPRILTDREAVVPLGDAAAYQLNAGRTGFFRTHYAPPVDLEALGRHYTVLDPADRWGLQEDLFALVRAGAVPAGRYLDWLRTCGMETADLPLTGMAQHVLELYRVLGQRDRPAVAEAGRRLSEAILGRIGLDPRAGEPHGTARLRDELLWPAVLYDASGVGTRLRGMLRALEGGAAPHPDLLKGLLQAGAWLEGLRFLDPLVGRFRQAASEHERLAVLAALGSFQAPEALHQAWEFVVGEVPERIGYVALVAMAANPSAGPHLWGWLAGSRSRLGGFHPLLFERVLGALIPAAGLSEAQRVEGDARELLAGNPPCADAVRLALERLAINRRLRLAGLD